MGTISKGILGGFSGTVGTVIGGSWKGIDYMRSQPLKRTGTFSQSQLEQQAKFKLLVAFLQPLAGLLFISFRDYAVKMTGFNNAMSYNLRNAITGVYPSYSIDYSTALVSRGILLNAGGPAVTATSGTVKFTWTDNSGAGSAKATDKSILVVYCDELKSVTYTTEGANRSTGEATLDASGFSGKTVETYLGFISEDGKLVANSFYTGQLAL